MKHAIISQEMNTTMAGPLSERFSDSATPIPMNSPKIPFISSITGDWITNEQVAHFSKGLKTLFDHSNLVLLDIGPGQQMGSMVSQHDEKQQSTIIYACRHDFLSESDQAMVLNALGKLWLTGITIGRRKAFFQ
jgi:acyl transferase domain-containing protein